MDWNKTKTIFIFVFFILNVFLYTQYVNTYKEGQELELLGEKNIEARLKEDNITYNRLPKGIATASYVSAKVKKYSLNELPVSSNFSYKLLTENVLRATAKTPIKLENPTEVSELTEFVQQHVYEGTSFILSEIDEEARVAIFAQRHKNRTFYFNKNAYVQVHWNTNNEVYMYEQSMLGDVEELEQQNHITQPLEALQALYAKNLLKADDRIKDMNIGYSTLVQFTQTQVFAPTWEVYVETSAGEKEHYYVNAVEGKVVEITQDVQQVLEE